MRCGQICLLLMLVVTAISLASAKDMPNGWKRYSGRLFDISYPPGFTPRPAMPPTGERAQTDSAFFMSPDKTAEFYVFSPQWSGDPVEIALNTRTETLASTASKTVHEKLGDTHYRWQTIRAKNGSYSRSVLDITTDSTRLTFGFKYANAKVYAKYRKDYLRFQASLVQYAD